MTGPIRRLAGYLAALTCLVAVLAAQPAGAADIGAAEQVVRNVYGTSLSRRMQSGEALLANQKVTTQVESAARLVLKDASQLSLGPRSEVILDEFVYQPAKNFAQGALSVAKGLMRFTSSRTKLSLSVRTPTATIGIRGTIFDVMVDGRGTEVAVREGAVQVDSASGSQRVAAGQSLVVPTGGGAPVLGKPTPELEAAVAKMSALLPPSADQPRQKAQSAKGTQVAALDAKALEHVLLLEVEGGTIAIQLRPDLAPRHVAWLKDLVRQRFYDGLTFHSVALGFAAETGDPTGSGNGGEGKPMDPELSKASFARGSVGMKAAPGDAQVASSQFFILMKPAPHLDGKYTYIGDVVGGVELVDALNPGRPPAAPSRLLSVRLGADAAR